METLQGMRLFVRVANSESFSAAGRAFGLSPASVSRSINTLETQLGVRLVHRTSRQLALTEAGQLYLHKAVLILADIDALTEQVAQHQARPRGLLHVHTRVSIGRDYLGPLLPGFMTRYPEVTVKLFLTEEPRDLLDNNIDIAIRLGNLDEPDLAVRKLSDAAERILFASAAYLDRHGALDEPEALLRHNCLTWPLDGRFEDGHAVWQFRDVRGVRELRVTGGLQANNGDVLREAALAGMGIALLPIWCIAADLAAGRLRRLLPQWEVTPTTFDHGIYAVYHRTRHVPPKIRVFVDYLVQALHHAPAGPPPRARALPQGRALARLPVPVSASSHLAQTS
ncbi:DNA-binding transcriptional LysR family regulator [Humitalea rosea]|uniref:DNA-binding transcriptional LysR family regulator n=1 Tax=Humitalea rosea TaxID=990373 RepID=A0A2W7HZF0_9PROT|nr:LysR family transcriptional regulator [Humitalea rosea]PZW37841.1 DNA-binding transcriptional LysR family regulator [Humitalea rosea]